MHQLAAATRAQARQYQAAARDLAAANQRLQQAQDAVRRSERLAALGQLTAGLAHELRNPLGTIKASAEVLLRQLDANPQVARELAGYVRDEVDRINLLITRFLDFARPLEPRLAPTDINTLLDRAIAEVQRHANPNAVLFVRNYSPDIEPIPADESLLERVFTNLLTNAVEASAHGATVTVKTRPLARGVEVAVIDRGHGIHPAQRENIFNPFFTTKASGVGLGLAIVSKIVDGHRGRLSVESEPGQGSVFRVWLPATEVS
jgi:signal transduction histidine kinase